MGLSSNMSISLRLRYFFPPAFAFVALFINEVRSDSVDFAHHYLLSFRLKETLFNLSRDDNSLGEMLDYPKITHSLISVLSYINGSTLLSMQIVSLIAVCLIWLGVIRIIVTKNLISSLVALIFLGLTLLIGKHLKILFHGDEVVDYYFLAQIFGTAGIYLVLSGVAHANRRREAPLWLETSILTISSIVLIQVHLVPALILSGLTLIRCLDKIIVDSTISQQSIFRYKLYFIAPILIFVFVYFSPTYQLTKGLVSINGELNTEFLSTSFRWGSFLVFGSIYFLIQNLNFRKKRNYRIKLMQQLGLSVYLLALMQYIIFLLGMAAPYSYKKYVFFLTTVPLILAALKIEEYLSQKKYREITLSWKIMLIVCILGAHFALSSISFQGKTMFNTSELLSKESSIEKFIADNFDMDASKQNNAIYGLNNMNSLENYMFSIAMLRTEKEVAVNDLLYRNQIQDVKRYDFVLMPLDQVSAEGFGQCVVRSNIRYAKVDMKCIEGIVNSEKLECKNFYDFSWNNFVKLETFTGLSNPEPTGSWSNSEVIEFSCLLKDPLPRKLGLTFTPFLYGEHDLQRLIIRNKEGDFVTHRYRGVSGQQVLTLDSRDFINGDLFRLEIKLPDAIKPSDLGFNDDMRKIAIFLSKMTFSKD
jgi:hypothetical protein